MTVADDLIPTDVVRPEPAVMSRFDPMLRGLITFGLVERDPEGSEWRLVPAAQRRLDSLFSPSPPAEKLIYFGHRCGSCNERGPTRFSAGAFLCDDCRRQIEPDLARAAAPGA